MVDTISYCYHYAKRGAKDLRDLLLVLREQNEQIWGFKSLVLLVMWWELEAHRGKTGKYLRNEIVALHGGREFTTTKLWFLLLTKNVEGPSHCGEVELTVQKTWYSPHLTFLLELSLWNTLNDMRILSLNLGPILKRLTKIF